MGIGSLIHAEKRSADTGGIPAWLADAAGGTAAGVAVNENIALGLAAVWACILKIASTMGIFSLPVYERTGESGKARAVNHPLYRLLHDAPNPEMTAYEWRQIMMTNELLYGAGISEIEFDGSGYPIALRPLETPSVSPEKTQGNKVIYRVADSKGTRMLEPYKLLLFRYFPQIDGGWKSPIRVHRETLAAAVAVKEFGARTFGQGVNPAGVVSGVKRAIGDDALKTLKERFLAYRGIGNSHRLMILEEGEKFERIGLPPEDAQYLETRAFDITEIARIYDVPPVLIHELTKTTSWGSGIEQLKDGFITFTMQPHCAKWEQEINAKLVSVDDNRFYCEFLMDNLLRGNMKDRAESYKIGLQNGFLSINDVLAMENRNPLPDELGGARFIAANMQTLQKAIAAGATNTNGNGEGNDESESN
jgi:HK97 family phage portal protein